MQAAAAVSVFSTAQIDVAFCCDEGYLQPLTVTVASLLASATAPQRLRLWLLSRTLDPVKLAPLNQLITAAGAELQLVTVRPGEIFRRVPLSEHLTEATYFRLLLPDLLPACVTRVIYLDCDLIVRHPIEALWATPLGSASTAAVHNPRALNCGPIGLLSEDDYFNAGVLVIDLVRWREGRLHERALHFAATFPGKLLCHDQDALNHVLAGHWKRLDLRWNQQFKFFKHPATYLHISAFALRRARDEPFIVHYTSSTKPWHYTNDHPWRQLYFQHLDTTPFRGWRPTPRNLRERMRRTAQSVVPHHLRSDVIRHNYRPRFRVLKSLMRSPFARSA